ncbi:CdaR family protein [Carboxydothermus ferrireducens]|uniref:YbbR domain-containing protein n=1 Tax=Carboxydothermus ferrireducens DSM 11255 TaxID=1119529 RepID=A0ABX2RC14_9THEO|nr:YbbR-like domain-containing protein [Carboxydothermus ferrireducens]NYE58726.1 YbbR domain-containing protein [Carboxydothermus ferrireducens DSM 11255]
MRENLILKVTSVFLAVLLWFYVANEKNNFLPFYKKEVKVTPVITGKPAPGYQIVRTKITPPKIQVSGWIPSGVLQDTVFTEEINIDGARKSKKVTVSLIREDGVYYSTDRVEVYIEIDKKK